MANLASNQIRESASVLFSPVGQENKAFKALNKQVVQNQDTLSKGEQKGKAKQQTASARPTLPKPNKSKNVNYLTFMAEAFSKAFTAMAQGTEDQTKEYVGLQALDQEMSTLVVQSTKNAVAKEMKQAKVSEKVAAYQKKIAKEDATWGGILQALGVVVMIGAFAATFFTGGASDAVDGAAASLIDEGEESGVELSTLGTDVATPDSDATVDALEQEEPEMANNLNQNDVENAKSEQSTLKKGLKFAGKKSREAAVSTLFGSKQLIEGIQAPTTYKMLNKLAKTQSTVGKLLGQMDANNMYYEFYQQVLQRASGVVQEEGNDASDVLQTYGNITNAYQQMAYGLANAV